MYRCTYGRQFECSSILHLIKYAAKVLLKDNKCFKTKANSYIKKVIILTCLSYYTQSLYPLLLFLRRICP